MPLIKEVFSIQGLVISAQIFSGQWSGFSGQYLVVSAQNLVVGIP
jgi:hypothetical protein